MSESSEPVIFDDLQTCFNELKKQSVSYKLGQIPQTGGDEMQNPLHNQFALILAKIEETLAKQNKESEEYLKTMSMKASIIYEKAKIFLSENLLPDCQDLLEQALILIKEYAEHPRVAFLYMRIVNHLTYVLSRLGKLDEAKEILLNVSEEAGKCTPVVFSTDDLFMNTKTDEKISAAKLNRLNINNMQMLAWIYARLGNIQENLKTQHDILQKQIHFADGDILRWAEACFRLGSMFVTHGDWANAAYHLAVAEEVLNPLEVSMVPNPEVYAALADLARSWVYYGLQLFENSRKPKESPDIDGDIIESTEKLEINNDEKKKMLYIFSGLQVKIPLDIPVSTIESVEQAKYLFNYMQKWIKRARLFYTLRDYPMQYVNLCLDLSELYRFVALYEEDLESQYAVQKRRYDALETLSNILKEVRPSCYVAVNVELTKELVEVQMELMNLNIKKLYTPTQTPALNVAEETLRRQLNAFDAFHNKLESVSSSLNMANTTVSDSNKDPENDDTEASERQRFFKEGDEMKPPIKKRLEETSNKYDLKK